MSKISIIAAIGKNNELGKDNRLIWRLPKDLCFFKEMTMGKYIVMGRKTYESLPGNLPGRTSVVISSKNLEQYCDVLCYHDLIDALAFLENIEEDAFIIGGQSIYEQAIEVADTMYLTELLAEDYEADTYFPHFDKREWNVEHLESGIDNGISYQRNKYVRKKVK